MYYEESLSELRTYLKRNYCYRTIKFIKTQFTNSQELVSQITAVTILKSTKITLKIWNGMWFIISHRTNSHKQIKSINTNNKTESRSMFTWDLKWIQMGLKSQPALKSHSVYMAISLWPTLRSQAPFNNCFTYMGFHFGNFPFKVRF